MKLADLFNIPNSIDVEVDGVVFKDLKLRPPTQIEQGLFSRYLEKRAKEFAERCESDEERSEYRRLALIEGAGGCYDWGTDAYTLALKRPVTLAKMLQFVLQGANASLANCPEEAERIALHLITKRVAELAAVIGAAQESDPQKKTAILAAVGLPSNFLDSDNSKSDSSSSPSPPPSESAAASKPSDG